MAAQLTHSDSGQFITLKIQDVKSHLTHIPLYIMAAADITTIDILNKFI